jgi:hypothetical protein
MEYQHTQWGYFAVPTFLLFAVVAILTVGDDETPAWFGVAIVVFMVGLLALVLHFSRLQVTVGDGRVTAAFGSGRPHRVFELTEVTAVRLARNPWWHGWGVRKIPNGWMYNVWGFDAVELQLASGKTFRIGTNEPEELLAVLLLHVPK